MSFDRRKLLKCMSVFSAGSLLTFSPNSIAGLGLLSNDEKVEPPSDSDILHEQVLWYMGHATHGMADINECLYTKELILPNSEDSWFENWLDTAERVENYGHDSNCIRSRVSAGQAYARASNYYRASLIHYSEKNDPRIITTCDKAESLFEKSNKLLRYPGKPVSIPYEGGYLPGTFFRSPHVNRRRKAPILIMFQGFHAWPEEAKWVYDGAIKRGIHCLIFHGPGQGLVLRKQGQAFRHDWENVVSPVIDFAEKLPGINRKRIGLMGISFGGSLAPRAAAFDKRIKVCIANPGVLNWNRAMRNAFSAVPDVLDLLDKDPIAFDNAVNELVKNWPAAKWWFRDATWKHGVDKPHQLFQELEKFNNEKIVHKIKARTLIMDGESEAASPGEGEALYNALKCQKDYMFFDKESGSDYHCQAGGLALAEQRMFDWLQEYL